jgi:hypothetical protein
MGLSLYLSYAIKISKFGRTMQVDAILYFKNTRHSA